MEVVTFVTEAIKLNICLVLWSIL